VNENEQVELNDTERQVLNQIQSDFPIDPRPYEVLGRRLGMTEDEVVSVVRGLRERGVIRRIGGNFASLFPGIRQYALRRPGAG
jgi:DNA-binding Lrp family transcriptional regulator